MTNEIRIIVYIDGEKPIVFTREDISKMTDEDINGLYKKLTDDGNKVITRISFPQRQ